MPYAPAVNVTAPLTRSCAEKPTAPSTSAAPIAYFFTNAENAAFEPSANETSNAPALPLSNAVRSAVCPALPESKKPFTAIVPASRQPYIYSR